MRFGDEEIRLTKLMQFCNGGTQTLWFKYWKYGIHKTTRGRRYRGGTTTIATASGGGGGGGCSCGGGGGAAASDDGVEIPIGLHNHKRQAL